MTLSVIPRSQTSSAYVKDSVIHHLASSKAANSVIVGSRGDVISNRVLTSSVMPAEQVQSTFTSQYRPINMSNLQEVNEMYTNGNTYKGHKNAQG